MKKIILVLSVTLAFFQAFSQDTWFETEFSTKISKDLEFSLTPEIRFKDNFELNEYLLQTGLEYKFSKYFKLGAGYRFGYNINGDDEHESFGRFNVDAKTGFKMEKL